jgi:hypothetical protein
VATDGDQGGIEMTWQDVYPVLQMGLQVVIGGSIIVAVSRYFRAQEKTIASQKETIAALAEQMKAQSTVLQDFERLSKLMQQVIDTVSDPAALQREQAFRARVERDAAETLQKGITKAVSEATKDYLPILVGTAQLIGQMMRYIDPNQCQALIKASGLNPRLKEELLKDECTRPDISAANEQPLGQYQDALPPPNLPREPR